MWQIFRILTRTVNVLNTVLANYSLTRYVDKLHTDVWYCQTDGSLRRPNEGRMVWRWRWYHAIALLELLDWLSSRFRSSEFFNNGWSEILKRAKSSYCFVEIRNDFAVNSRKLHILLNRTPKRLLNVSTVLASSLGSSVKAPLALLSLNCLCLWVAVAPVDDSFYDAIMSSA